MSVLRTLKARPAISLLLLAYIAFIGLGMRDGLLGVAWPSIRGDFSKPLDSLGILLVAGVAGYTTSSFLIGSLIRSMGIGILLVISCTLASATLVVFSLAPSWWLVVLMSVIGGLGAGGIDAGLNTYVAAHHGERSMQWLHASYGLGITSGPIIMTLCLAQLNSWRAGYRIVGSFIFAILVCLILTLPRWRQQSWVEQTSSNKKLIDYKTPMLTTLGQPRAWLSALLFFLYVGAEFALGSWTYSLLVESRGVAPELAGFWTGSYWATFTIGRVLAGLFANRLGINRMLLVGLVGALLGALLLAWNPSTTANVVAVGLIGFCIAPVFPAFMSGTSQRVGMQHAGNTIGLQMAATGLGGALIPGVFGVLAGKYSLEVIPILLVVVFIGLLAAYLLSIKTRPQNISL